MKTLRFIVLFLGLVNDKGDCFARFPRRRMWRGKNGNLRFSLWCNEK